MKVIIVLLFSIMLICTGCNDGRYTGYKLWEPGSHEHGTICAIKDWKTGKKLPVNSIPDNAWDHSEWDWVPREGCKLTK